MILEEWWISDTTFEKVPVGRPWDTHFKSLFIGLVLLSFNQWQGSVLPMVLLLKREKKEMCYSAISSFSAIAFSSSKGPCSPTCTSSILSSFKDNIQSKDIFRHRQNIRSLALFNLCRERSGVHSCTASGELQRSNLDQPNPSNSDSKKQFDLEHWNGWAPKNQDKLSCKSDIKDNIMQYKEI